MRIFFFATFLIFALKGSAQIPFVMDDEKELRPVYARIYTPEQLDGTELYVLAEIDPVFPLKYGGLQGWISKNLKYPKKAIANKEEGFVLVSIIIEKDGSISKREVVKKLSPSTDKEALRLISIMPKWIPGKVKDKNVRVEQTIRFNFKLPKK